ncbi:hypothetical protein JY98_15490 [Exiguobacterium mexicanum]|nr:hypothetical protein JY98_15490 [Exiguobacterium mexicanum]
MSTENVSYLKFLDRSTKIKVLNFKDLDYDAFLRTGKIVDGEISFVYREFGFDMGRLDYKVIHNEKAYRFDPKSNKHDAKMGTIVSGILRELD